MGAGESSFGGDNRQDGTWMHDESSQLCEGCQVQATIHIERYLHVESHGSRSARPAGGWGDNDHKRLKGRVALLPGSGAARRTAFKLLSVDTPVETNQPESPHVIPQHSEVFYNSADVRSQSREGGWETLQGRVGESECARVEGRSSRRDEDRHAAAPRRGRDSADGLENPVL